MTISDQIREIVDRLRKNVGIGIFDQADGILLLNVAGVLEAPIPMRLTCPICRALHIDEGEFATKPHHTHACQSCGHIWRPAIVPTVGVRFLPGFKNEDKGSG